MAGDKRELLMRVIDLCESVRKKGLDPFDVEVREFFDRLRELLPKLRRQEEFYLDIQAVLGLSEVVYQQGEWVKHRSSALYLDPLLVMLKVHALSNKELADVLVRSWHPIVDVECVTDKGFREAMDYWSNLPSLEERLRGLDVPEVLTGELARKELEKMGVLSEEDFVVLLDRTWRELKEQAGGRGEIPYWEFVFEKSFEGTILRAWLVSFLVSYGYATMEIRPIEEEIILRPLPKPEKPEQVVTFSVPIAISREEWLRRLKNG
ncbi:MAG: hypothetical protein QW567_01640 [Candidatus Hadarchaeales archaeon]